MKRARLMAVLAAAIVWPALTGCVSDYYFKKDVYVPGTTSVTQQYPPLDSRSQPADIAQKGPVYYNRSTHVMADPRYYLPWADAPFNPENSEVMPDETPYRFNQTEPNRYHPFAH